MDQLLTSFGPAGAIVAVVLLFLKYMREDSTKRDRSYDKLSQAIDHNTKVTNETHKFLKNLNGSLRKSVETKQKEAQR